MGRRRKYNSEEDLVFPDVASGIESDESKVETKPAVDEAEETKVTEVNPATTTASETKGLKVGQVIRTERGMARVLSVDGTGATVVLFNYGNIIKLPPTRLF